MIFIIQMIKNDFLSFVSPLWILSTLINSKNVSMPFTMLFIGGMNMLQSVLRATWSPKVVKKTNLSRKFADYWQEMIINHYLCDIITTFIYNMEDVNRIKLVLVEKKRTSKWLSEQLGVNPSTVSKWCTNTSQPDVACLLTIADLLEVDIKELLVREYKSYLLSKEPK